MKNAAQTKVGDAGPGWLGLNRVTCALALLWLALAAVAGWWMTQRMVSERVAALSASAQYEAITSARVIDRLFTEMVSVANMVARQADVIQLARSYRIDPPGADAQTRQQRAARFTADPLVRKVGDYMDALSRDLRYARIYVTNMSDDTVTASNWAAPDSIVGMIYSGRPYLTGALQHGTASSFGIARLLKTPSYFIASRIDDPLNEPQGAVTIKFDASDMASYLVGRHVALVVNRQGRVTTAAHGPFMLRNVAALLPAGSILPAEDDEDPGEPLDIVPLPGAPEGSHDSVQDGDQWLIEGQPWLVRSEPLADAQYHLLTLAPLGELTVLRQRQYWTTALVAIFGLALILLAGKVVGEAVLRRRDERHAAHHDALTDLPNRRAVLAELDRLFVVARRTGQQVLVAFIDLDGFKVINDAYGHEIGDKFLVAVARRLSGGMRDGDMLGRWGGDEFVAIGLAAPARQAQPDETVEAVRRRLVPLLIGTYHLDAIRFDYPGASFGIVSVNPSESSPQAALKTADMLMYADKQARQLQFDLDPSGATPPRMRHKRPSVSAGA